MSGTADGAPVEGMSRVRHPLLLEAVLRFQANARSELLPTDGPVKIRNDDNDPSLEEDRLADALERATRSEIAAFALVVDAKDEAAAAFYSHHGFIALPDSPLTLFLPLATVRRS